MSNNLLSIMLDAAGDAPHSVGMSDRSDAEDKNITTKWLKSSDNTYSTIQNSDIKDSLESGVYYVFQDSRGALHAQKTEPDTDDLYDLPNNHIQKVLSETEDFWSKAELFKKYGIKHKRGILFEGPPGTGKTSLINQLSEALIKRDGLVFIVSSMQELYFYVDFVHDSLRLVEPERPIIVIIEDIDKYMDEGPAESALLNFLDGSDSVDHQVVVATTNRFDDLNDLLLRPSRFDWHVSVTKPDEAVREAYLLNKGLDEKKAKDWAKDTDTFSLAELKELFISVILLDIDYKVAKTKINDQADAVGKKTTSKTRKKKDAALGFNFGK